MPQNAKLVQLENDLYDLKSAFDSPRVYLANYFDDFCNMIDIDFSLSITFRGTDGKITEKEAKDIAEEQDEMIKAVRVFEHRCLENWKQRDSFSESFRSKIIDAVAEIEQRILELKAEGIFESNENKGLLSVKSSRTSMRSNHGNDLRIYEVLQLIKKTMAQVQDIIFQNKSVLYLQKKRLLETIKAEDPEVNPMELLRISNCHTVGLLVFVDDAFIDRSRFNLVRKKMGGDNKEEVIKWFNKQDLSAYFLETSLYQVNGLITHIHLKLEEKTLLNLNLKQLTKIDKGVFKELTSLQKCDLNDNELMSLDPGTFHGLSNLVEIDLTFNEIESLAIEQFKDLNKLKILRLGNNQLSSIDVGTFRGLDSLEELYIEFNKITHFDKGVFQDLKSLKVLFIDNNEISSLDPDVFKGLERLEKLNFVSNNLKSLDKNVFTGLKSVKSINFCGNQISRIHYNIAGDMPKLEILHLSDNMLSSLDFLGAQFGHLRELHLDGNALVNLNGESFRSLKNLKILYLQNNQLRSLVPANFEGLESLIEVYFNGNHIAKLPNYLFKRLVNLESLQFGSNQLVELDTRVFLGLSKLKSLSLEKNDLSRLHPDIFKGLYNLETLSLNDNAIEAIDPEIFKTLTNLELLTLRGNRISESNRKELKETLKLKYIFF